MLTFLVSAGHVSQIVVMDEVVAAHVGHVGFVVVQELFSSTHAIMIMRYISILSITNHLWSMETNVKSSLCLDLNMTSFCGISNSEGGPNGVHMQKRASGGSSVFLF